MLLQIAEGLLLRVECRRKPAHLPMCAEREKESDGPAVVRLGSTHDPLSPACDRPFQCSALALRGRYVRGFLERFLREGAGKAARSASSAASLASRTSRSRAMFLRTSMACLSTSANARAPSSAATRLRSERAMLSGDGSAGFFALIAHLASQRTKPAQSEDRAGRGSVSVHP